MSVSITGARLVLCPTCSGPSIYAPDNAFRPFCSARCKNNDFGAWASEGYRVSAETSPDDPVARDDGEPIEPLPH